MAAFRASRAFLLTAMLAAPLLLDACGDSSKSAAGPGAGLGKVVIPEFDPAAPFPAMSGPTLDALAADVPGLAKVKDAVLAAERDALKGAFDNGLAKSNPAAKSKPARKKVGAATPSWMPAAGAGSFSLISVAMAGEAGAIGMDNLMTMVVANNLIVLSGDSVSNQDTSSGGGSKTVSMPGKEAGTVDASMTLSAEAGGPVTSEVTTKVNLPLYFLEANSKASITGDLCPNADGKVEFTMKLASDGRAGSGGSSIYDRSVEAKIAATVGEDANTVNADIEMKQATRSTAGGRQVYVESSQTGRVPSGDFSRMTVDQPKLIRASSQATSADEQLAHDGHARAQYLVLGALLAAERHWKDGKCIKIEAASPGTVKPGATSKIPVAVKHRKDGSSMPAKVTAQLSGGVSVDPGVIARAPGDITHVASKEKDARMTIALTATSRRGKAQATLDINTNIAAAYQIVGGLDDWKTNTRVCDIMQPYTLTGGGFTMQFSGGLSGTYSYTGPFNSHGTGTYTVSLPEGVGKPGTMTGGGTGYAAGHSNTGTERYTLTPLEPCS